MEVADPERGNPSCICTRARLAAVRLTAIVRK
jgi:hypothetical protein